MDERLEAWMKAKHAKTVFWNLAQRVGSANQRGAKRITIPTELAEEILSLIAHNKKELDQK